jgi:hypothetical protein
MRHQAIVERYYNVDNLNASSMIEDLKLDLEILVYRGGYRVRPSTFIQRCNLMRQHECYISETVFNLFQKINSPLHDINVLLSPIQHETVKSMLARLYPLIDELVAKYECKEKV